MKNLTAIKWLLLGILSGLIVFFAYPWGLMQIGKYRTAMWLFEDCHEVVSVEKCPNGDWVTGRYGMRLTKGTYDVYNRWGYLVVGISGGLPGDGVAESTPEYRLRKQLKLSVGCNQVDSIKRCNWKDEYDK